MASGSQRRFVDWEERFVSHDRGSRVVHYYLRDRQGQQCLAVIGTERSLRHMVYVVCDDFLPLAGLDKSTTSAFKWRARREVVDWLSAFLIRTRSPEAVAFSAGSPLNGFPSSTDADSSFSREADGLESGQEECRSRCNENDSRKQCSVSKADVVWVGSAWSCRKRLRHFHSFQRNGIVISVQNFVYVMTEEKDRHIAYVEDLFEDKKQRKKLRVRWFHKTSELTCKIPPPVPHSREVFYTTFQQDLSVECVDGVATVLSPEHYDSCSATLPGDSSAQVLMCSRQFDNDGIKSFNIQEVKGYWRQPILSLARIAAAHENSPQSDLGSEDFEMDEDDCADLSRRVRRGPRTARCSRRRTGLGKKMVSRGSGDTDGADACISSEAGGSGPFDAKFLSRNVDRVQSASQDQKLWRYDVGDHVEVLSEDSGLRGCWFKATVVRRCFRRRLKVRYEDVTCADGKGHLEEWISSCKIAGPCKLGVRISGRPCIRPFPPESTSVVPLNEGEVVDAWWNDGWWEGILFGKGSSDLLHVFILGESETVVLKSSEVRASKEWLNGTWAAIPSYLDLVMELGLSVEHEAKAKDQRLRGGEYSLHVEPGQTPKEERSPYRVNGLRNASVEAVDQSQNGHDWNRSIKDCCASLKEESRVSPGTEGQQEVQNVSSPCKVPGSPRSGGPPTPIRLIFRQFPQDSRDDGTNSDVKHNLVTPSSGGDKPAGIGLKWKAGRKRHRQGDLVTSRMDRNAGHSASEVKDHDVDISREDVGSDGENRECAPLEDVENVRRWKNGDGEEIVKHKKQRKGNDNTLKSLHGTPMGSSMFMGSLPIANLVMSR